MQTTKTLRLFHRAAAQGAARVAPRCVATSATLPLAALSSTTRRSLVTATQLHKSPLLVPHAVSKRALSMGKDMLIRQADQILVLLGKAEKDITHTDEHHNWRHLDPEGLDDIVDTVGRCRDFVNGLSEEECATAEAHNKVISQTEYIEGMLETAVKCDELSAIAHDLRMEIEDVGTEGDGANHPGAFTKAWNDRVDKLFNDYADLLEKCDKRYVQRLENELGYELLLLKRVVHIDNFRYHYPRVHPSGFSASAD